MTRRIFRQIVCCLVEAVRFALRAKLLNLRTVSVVGDGKEKRAVLHLLAIEDCTLEATYGTVGIREVTRINIDATFDSDNDSGPLHAIKAVKHSQHW